MQLNDANLIASLSAVQPSLSEYLVACILRHAVSNDLHGALALKRDGFIGGQRLRYNLDGLVLKAVLVNEVLRDDDTTRRAILCADLDEHLARATRCWFTYGGRTAHELRELLVDHRSGKDLFDAPSIAELGVRIVHRVLVILARYIRRLSYTSSRVCMYSYTHLSGPSA